MKEPPPQEETVEIIRMSEVDTQAVEWLWEPYIPFGKVTIVQGNPGEGKTTFALRLAAACTTGGTLPGMKPLPPFQVIYQTAEDGLGDTVKPRLIEAAADLDRVLVIDEAKRELTLSDERIEKAIVQNGARLIILDPIQAYMGEKADMNKANEVRPIFRRLAEVAERTGCAVILIGHLNKAAGGQSAYRGLGSIDFRAAARSVLLIGRVKREPNVRVIVHDKSSLAPEGKADMFTKRTIKPHEAVTTVDTASEALAVSISEKACVDMGYMASLTGRTEEELAEELRGVIFRIPGQTEPDGTPRYVSADEYLSGNVRRKLRQAQRAAEHDPAFSVNVEALTAAQPKDLDASEIEVRLGATWIDKKYIQQFMYETFQTPSYLRGTIEVNYMPYTAEWQVTGKNAVSYNNVAAYTTYGTSRANAYKILEDSLNLRDVRVYDTIEEADGKERRVLNTKETTLAAQKQQAIREAFKDWIWKDPERRQALVYQYNEEMNSTRPREYDGSHIVFGGMNPAITLREHQLGAIAHVLYGGNTLLAHEVGAGKTFEMVAAAMESKRLGLCQKSLFVVPNHLTEQWASEFLRLYPSANLLVTTKKDFEKHNRKKFCARIATGDYDAIIMGHSQFEKIPVSRERQERLLREQMDEIAEGIQEVRNSGGERFTVKQLERTRKSLEVRLEKLQAEGRKDDVVTFEQLGVDRLFVDEAHNYKNLFLYTKMRNVAGLSTSDAQKSSDMFAKCRYMDEITGSRGVIFATGTPVSNSMTELYTMQRYLQYDRLQELGMTHFDCWASRFGETTTALELAPEGTGYRARTRFSKFFNLPELMNLFKEVADIKTADQLHLPTPEVEYHNIVAQPTEHQKEMVKILHLRREERRSFRRASLHQLIISKINFMYMRVEIGTKEGYTIIKTSY